MDDADRAEELIEQVVEDGRAEASRRAASPEIAATGECRFCLAPLPAGLRFCDADCRNAWQHENDLKMMRGVR